MGTIVTVVLILIVIGVLLWLVDAYIPMDNTIKMLIKAVVIIGTVIWLLFKFFPNILSL